MSLWNKILVGLIGVTSLALFYMSARTLQTHRYWRDAATKFDLRIKQLQEENQRLVNNVGEPGQPGQMGIRQLRGELGKLLLDRRRAWFKCEPKLKLDRQNAAAEITLTIYDPTGISENSILYGFSEANVQKQGRYLGQFTVTKTDQKQKQVVIVPTAPLSAGELDRLEAAKGPWELYEVMPRDNHEVFASLSDEQKKEILPKSTVQEYLKDGGSSRPIRDYQTLLGAERVRRTLLVDQIDAATGDLKLVDDALAQAKQQEEAVKQDVATAKDEVKRFTAQRDAVAAYRKTNEQELGAAKASVDDLLKNNQEMAAQIAKLQLDAARRIDQRTRAMARSGAGGT